MVDLYDARDLCERAPVLVVVALGGVLSGRCDRVQTFPNGADTRKDPVVRTPRAMPNLLPTQRPEGRAKPWIDDVSAERRTCRVEVIQRGVL